MPSFRVLATSALAITTATATGADTAAPSFNSNPNAGQANWTKVLMPTANNAVCLDGSPGGFYLRSNPDSKDWIIFSQGGGWCSSTEDCLGRAKTDLGSSKGWGPTYTDTYEGSAMFNTPPFDTYNVAYAKYCDGGSWSGDTEEVFNGTTIHYRGKPLLDTMLDVLLHNHGMADAETLIYSGCSAGGLTTYLHADYVATRVKEESPDVAVVAVADAMFSLDHNTYSGTPAYQNRMEWGFQAWNSSQGVNADCLAHWGEAKGAMCMLGEYASLYVQTPTFIINSKYDTWQQGAILGLNCSIGACDPGQEEFFVDYGHSMVDALAKVPARHGAFLTNCPAHCQTGTGGDWTKRSVNGVPLGVAMPTWFNKTIAAVRQHGTASLNSTRWVANCDEKPCGDDVC